MNNLAWRFIAWIVTREWVFRLLLKLRRPYLHITSADGSAIYMERYWLFNPYLQPGHREWLPSIRLHRIMRADSDRHLHDRSWNARTIVLRGWYHEIIPASPDVWAAYLSTCEPEEYLPSTEVFEHRARMQGYTGRLLFGEYHRITEVPADGVWTLFFTWRKRGTWGFNVDGTKVPYKEYLNNE